MFTGIVEATGKVTEVKAVANGLRIRIESDVAATLAPGASLAGPVIPSATGTCDVGCDGEVQPAVIAANATTRSNASAPRWCGMGALWSLKRRGTPTATGSHAFYRIAAICAR